MKRLSFVYLILFVALLDSCSASRLMLTPNSIITQEVLYGNYKRIIVKGNVDLGGQSLNLPPLTCLDIRHGSLRNGRLILDRAELICEDTSNLNCSIQGTCRNKVLVVNNVRYGYSHISVLQEGSTAYLTSDIVVPKTLELKCSIEGINHPTLVAANKLVVLLSIVASDVLLHNITLENDNDTESQKCFAIRSLDVDGVTMDSITVRGGSVFFRNTNDSHYHGYNISNSCFLIDHSRCEQSFERQNDAFEFRGIQDLTFCNNSVITKNVTRVFKTPAGGSSGTPCHNLVFKDNHIASDCMNGKQVFDFYNFTRDVAIVGNTIVAKGHTDVFENKSAGDDSQLSILIEDNVIDYSNALLYFNLSVTGNNSITLRNNHFRSTSSSCPQDSIRDNSIITTQRLRDCDFRNINSILIDNNVFSGVGEYDGHLFYFDNANSIDLANNEIDGNWGQIAKFYRLFDTVKFCGNTENQSSTTLSSAPIFTFSSAIVHVFESKNNTFNREGGSYRLINRSEIATSIIDNTGFKFSISGNSFVKEIINL